MTTAVQAHRLSAESGPIFKGCLNTPRSPGSPLSTWSEMRGYSREKTKIMNDFVGAPDGCGLLWRSGQLGVGFQVRYELQLSGLLGFSLWVRDGVLQS